MGDTEKSPSLSGTQSPSSLPSEAVRTPTGWRYKKFQIGPKTLWYSSPPVQLFIVSMVCFFTSGMFNAVTGIGGSGLTDPTVADKYDDAVHSTLHQVANTLSANVALYSTFSVVGFFAGTITNRIGVRWALSFGGIGYVIYIGSFLSFKTNGKEGFPYFAGALLGCCAGLLWSAQGAVMMSYPSEKSKGRYISAFWGIFNLGAVIGGLIPLGENIHRQGQGNVTDGTYIGFIVLTLLGAAAAWLLVNAKDVIRNDGSRVIVMKHPSWLSEIKGLFETFKLEPYIVLLFPMFWASNWFYTYQFNSVNGAVFDVRTRALNSVLYWTAQIVGAGLNGLFLDIGMRRRTKALVAWVNLFVLTMAIWGGGYAWQQGYTRAEAKHVDANGDPDPLTHIWDWNNDGYVGPMFLYFFYGFYDAVWQTTVYWLMGALTNNGRRLANYAGFYKGIQSAGAAVAYRSDAQGIPYMSQFASCWALCGGSLVLALPLLVLKVKDHSSVEDDLKFSDESFEEVAAQHERPREVAEGRW